MNDKSPAWSSSVKLVVGLTIVAIVAALMVRFHNILGPLLMAMILAYLLHPLAAQISRRTGMSWRAAVNLIYIFLVILVISLITATGVAVVQQTQNLYGVVEEFVENLPQIVEDLSTQVIRIGAYELDLGEFLAQPDLERFINQAIGIVQPVLGQAGGLIGSIASGTFSTLGWIFFILLVSYFTLADAGHFPDIFSGLISSIDLPDYQADLSRLGKSLARIWNAFIRGQLFLFAMTMVVVFVLLTILGVRNALALALVAGFARFVPYIGPLIVWVITGLVAFFQAPNYLGIAPLPYTALVIAVIVIFDQVVDNLVTPRLYGQALGVHPAAVLVAAIVAANLLGLIGLLLAAPVLATLLLFGRYAVRKLFDMDPWSVSGPRTGDERSEIYSYRAILARIKNRFPERFRRNYERTKPPTRD